jgi:hypothetical protein
VRLPRRLKNRPEVFLVESRKRIWEIQHQTICKVIGMALGPKDLKKIARKFGICSEDPFMGMNFALHSTAVHLCGGDNRISRHIQKMIDVKFARYAKRISERDPAELIRAVQEGGKGLEAPLWAVLWDLSTRGIENCASVETALFGYIHMMEHRLVKDFWNTQWDTEGQERSDKADFDPDLKLKRRLLDLQREVERSRKLSDTLSRQVEQMRSPSRRAGLGVVPSESPSLRIDSEATNKISRLRGLLYQAREEKGALEKENERLRAEMEVLVKEISAGSDECSAGRDESGQCTCPAVKALGGKRIAMVGGIDSLERHYRSLVETMGGVFERHNGECGNGLCRIDACIRNADLVVCPFHVNSHNAAKAAKKFCKRYGIPCSFPRSAGLAGLKSAIGEHFKETQVA